MRIVKNLDKTTTCPNCGCGMLYGPTKEEYGLSPRKICTRCDEEIFEDEDTQYELINVGRAPDDIDDTLMDIEYEVGNLPRYATNKDELEYLERIRDIFDELISVIRRMK